MVSQRCSTSKKKGPPRVFSSHYFLVRKGLVHGYCPGPRVCQMFRDWSRSGHVTRAAVPRWLNAVH